MPRVVKGIRSIREDHLVKLRMFSLRREAREYEVVVFKYLKD